MSRAYLPKVLAISLLTAGFSFAGAQQAQQAPDPSATTQPAPQHYHHAPDPQKQTAYLTKELNLTADQSAKVEPILAARDQQLQALRGDQQLSPEDRHQQMKAINQQAQQQMAGVLSPEQMSQLKEMRHHHGHHGRNGNAPEDNNQSQS